MLSYGAGPYILVQTIARVRFQVFPHFGISRLGQFPYGGCLSISPWLHIPLTTTTTIMSLVGSYYEDLCRHDGSCMRFHAQSKPSSGHERGAGACAAAQAPGRKSPVLLLRPWSFYITMHTACCTYMCLFFIYTCYTTCHISQPTRK